MENDNVSGCSYDHAPSPQTFNTDTCPITQGVVVDLYVPRKCMHNHSYHRCLCHKATQDHVLTAWCHVPAGAATSRLITAKDHSSVQINIAEVDEQGKMITGKNVSYAFSGYVRSIGEADDSLNMLATGDGRGSTI